MASHASASPPPARCVLVVEDDRALRSVVADALSEHGYQVLEASNGFSALRLAEQHRPDVILLDLALPEVSGPSVLVSLRGSVRTRRIPVIVTTGFPARLEEPGTPQPESVLTKPFHLADLLVEVDRAAWPPAARGETAVPPATVHRRRARRRPRVHAARGRSAAGPTSSPGLS